MSDDEISFRPIKYCRGCHAPAESFAEVLRMEPMPLAGQFCRTLEEARDAVRIPLTWEQCTGCQLVQVLEDVSDRVLFTRYNYASSTVPGLVRHFEQYARFLVDRYGSESVRLAEIGCNDGVLLRQLPRQWRLLGIDPSDVAGAAPDRPYELLQRPFDSNIATEISDGAKFDVVTGSNCLAHISDLHDIFLGVRTLLRDGGEFILEVHDLEATAATGQWDTIYHEHKAEWSAQSLTRCLGALGFEQTFLMRLPLHAGLLRVGFKKTGRSTQSGAVGNAPSLETLRRTYETRRETETYRLVSEALAHGRSVSAYGASGRANVWLNQLPELRLAYIVDDSPLRSGKWLPCVATPVLTGRHFAEHPTDLCVITAWNFAADIRAKYPGFHGRWLQSLGPTQ
jgi:SAM-dependent methyltransferase